MCLSRGPQRRGLNPQPLGLESSTLPLRSLSDARGGAWGSGVPRGSKNYFFQHGHVAYQIDGDNEQNRIQEKFSHYGQTGALEVRSKGQILLNLITNIFIPNFVCVRTKKI